MPVDGGDLQGRETFDNVRCSCATYTVELDLAGRFHDYQVTQLLTFSMLSVSKHSQTCKEFSQ